MKIKSMKDKRQRLSINHTRHLRYMLGLVALNRHSLEKNIIINKIYFHAISDYYYFFRWYYRGKAYLIALHLHISLYRRAHSDNVSYTICRDACLNIRPRVFERLDFFFFFHSLENVGQVKTRLHGV